MISGFLKNMVRRIKDLFNMLNDDSYIIGHHGTSEEAARSILNNGFQLALSQAGNRYNDAIYFWLNGPCSLCLAKSWSWNRYKTYSAIESKIRRPDYDLTLREEEIAKFANLYEKCDEDIDKWSSAALEYLADVEIDNSEEVIVFISFCRPAPIASNHMIKSCYDTKQCAKAAKSVIVRKVDSIIENRRINE